MKLLWCEPINRLSFGFALAMVSIAIAKEVGIAVLHPMEMPASTRGHYVAIAHNPTQLVVRKSRSVDLIDRNSGNVVQTVEAPVCRSQKGTAAVRSDGTIIFREDQRLYEVDGGSGKLRFVSGTCVGLSRNGEWYCYLEQNRLTARGLKADSRRSSVILESTNTQSIGIADDGCSAFILTGNDSDSDAIAMPREKERVLFVDFRNGSISQIWPRGERSISIKGGVSTVLDIFDIRTNIDASVCVILGTCNRQKRKCGFVAVCSRTGEALGQALVVEDNMLTESVSLTPSGRYVAISCIIGGLMRVAEGNEGIESQVRIYDVSTKCEIGRCKGGFTQAEFTSDERTLLLSQGKSIDLP